MRFKTRYRFWNVFLVVLAVFIFMGCIIFITYALFPSDEAKNEMMKHADPAWIYAVRYGIGFLFIVSFFYFATNYYYNLLADKKKFISFLKVSLAILFI